MHTKPSIPLLAAKYPFVTPGTRPSGGFFNMWSIAGTVVMFGHATSVTSSSISVLLTDLVKDAPWPSEIVDLLLRTSHYQSLLHQTASADGCFVTGVKHRNTLCAHHGDHISKHADEVYQVFWDSQTPSTTFIYYEQEIWRRPLASLTQTLNWANILYPVVVRSLLLLV